MRRVGVELGAVRAAETGDVAREFADRDVHAKADPQIRDPVLPSDLRGADLALESTTSEPAGDQDPVGALEPG